MARRTKLFDGAIVEHGTFGRLTITAVTRKGVIPPELWEAIGEDGKRRAPSYNSERGLHFSLRWYCKWRPYKILNPEAAKKETQL